MVPPALFVVFVVVLELNDGDCFQADRLLSEADRLEDSRSKRHTLTAAEFVYDQECDAVDSGSETVGLVTVSSKPDALGMVRDLSHHVLLCDDPLRRVYSWLIHRDV